MIRSFRGKDTEALWQRRYVKKISPELSRAVYSKLALINAAESINDLRVPPGNRLEKLAGARAGHCSIRINDQWRICFTWSASGAANVELSITTRKEEDRWQTSHPPTPARFF